jgi:hypothetical protein
VRSRRVTPSAHRTGSLICACHDAVNYDYIAHLYLGGAHN